MQTIRPSLLIAGLFVGVTLAISSAVFAQSAPPTASAQAPGVAEFSQGVQLHDGGKPLEAVPLFKAAIAKGFVPVNQARVRLARAYIKAGQPELANTEFDALLANTFANVGALGNPDFNPVRTTATFIAFEKQVNANAHPCAADPNFRAFDFWIGEWDVQGTGPQRAPIGQGATSIIEKQLDGCVIQENWHPLSDPIGAGKSFNTYNSVTKQWEQYYVDQRGTITHYKGTFHADGNLYYEADQFASANKIRMTFFNQGPNQVRQVGHASSDGGKTWNVTFDLTYVRKPPK